MVASRWVKIGLISYFPSPAWPVTRSHRSTRRFLGLNICSANALPSWVRDSLYIFSTACPCRVDRGRVSSCFDAFSVTSEQPSLNVHLPSLKIGILSSGIFFFLINCGSLTSVGQFMVALGSFSPLSLSLSSAASSWTYNLDIEKPKGWSARGDRGHPSPRKWPRGG